MGLMARLESQGKAHDDRQRETVAYEWAVRREMEQRMAWWLSLSREAREARKQRLREMAE
jgi:hypothetical protein